MGGFYRNKNGTEARTKEISLVILSATLAAAVQIRNTWLISKGGVSSSPSVKQFAGDVTADRAALGGNLMLIHVTSARAVERHMQ